MSRVKGRAPRATPSESEGTAAANSDGEAPSRSRARRIADVTAGVAASVGVGVASTAASGVSWWWAAAIPVTILVVWAAWRWAARRLGRLTGAAAVCGAAFAFTATLYAAAPNCPMMVDSGRCSATEVGQAGFISLLSAAILVASCAAAVALWTALVAAVVRVPRAVGAARSVGGRLEADRRARRELGVRWVRAPWHTDPVVWAAAVGTVGAGVYGWTLGGAASAALWAVGGFLVAGGVPAAWRAGTTAGSQRFEYHQGRRRRR